MRLEQIQMGYFRSNKQALMSSMRHGCSAIRGLPVKTFRCGQCLLEVGDDIVDVLDPYADANHSWLHSGGTLLLGGHLSMSGRGRVAGQRLGIAQVDEPLDEFERIVEFLGGYEASLDPESHQRTGAAAQIFLCKSIVKAVWEARVVDPIDSGMPAQEFGDGFAVFRVALDP